METLGAFGGPTPTIDLQAGSPAMGQGAANVCQAAPSNNHDQRGVARITATDPTGDIGAFER